MSYDAVIIDDTCEDSEYTQPVNEFTSAGHMVIHMGLEAAEQVQGKKQETPVTVDVSVSDILKLAKTLKKK